MSKVSIIIPSRGENYEVAPGVTVLQRMIKDIYEKATGDFEVLVALDGPPYQKLPKKKNLRVIELPGSIGLKPSVNLLAGLAKGKYIYKSDSHCMFGPGFDEILQADMEDNWLVTPRFYVLDAEKWKWQDSRHYDYFFLHCPLTDPDQFKFKAGGHWPQRTAEREGKKEYLIDETMQMHGSGWFVTKKFFWENLKGMSSEGYDTFAMEPPELCLKTWLGPWGGRVMVNKKTWYAHMHKGGQRPRGWPLSNDRIWRAYDWCARYWMGNKWEERAHDLEWLVEKFMPVPTWPENWRELWQTWKAKENKVEPVKIFVEKPDPTPKMAYTFNSFPSVKSRTDLAKYFAQAGFKKGVEIGVFKGEFAKILLDSIPGLKYYGIDPWDGGIAEYKEARKNIKGYKKAKLIKKPSLTAVDDFPDNSLDFVYIDGNHRFDFVMQDILKWIKKVRKGGIIAGHDYVFRADCGVIPAVNAYTQMHSLKHFVTTDPSEEISWWFLKRWNT